MAWVRFTAAFHWRPKPNVWITYQAGDRRNVTRDCAALAIAGRKAIRITAHAVRGGSPDFPPNQGSEP